MAFILLTVGVAGWGRKAYLPVCLFWLIIDAGFELGQKYNTQAVSLVPDWFDDIFLLDNIRSYFVSGTYSLFDMAAIVGGACLGYWVLLHTEKKGDPHEAQPKIY